MPQINTGQVIELYRQILGHENVITDDMRLREAQTATFKTTQKILAILKPKSMGAIKGIVEIAREHKTPLYTISTGKNWGYGSRIPVKDNSMLLELSGMNKIVDYSEELGYVTVEPGVTQKQLHEFLKKNKSRFSLSTTGSTPDSSIIGNICERGVGLGPYSFRAHYVSALEVILPSGKCIHTGFGRFSNAHAAQVYPEGIVTSFLDMFIQSNLGIITKLTLLLAPTPAYTQFIDMYISKEDLPKTLEITRTFNFFTNSRKTISLHNDFQMLASKTQYPWNVTKGKTPLPAEIKARLMQKHNITSWRGIVEIHGYTKQEVVAQVRYFQSLAKKLDGINLSPVYRSDELVSQPKNIGKGIYWRMKTKPPRLKSPDIDGCGNIRLSLAVPFTAGHINEVLQTIENTVTQSGFEPFIEIHCISERAVLVVASLVFDRTAEGQDTKALGCHDTLLRSLIRLGYYPYRLNVHATALIPKSTDDYDYFQKTIKQAIDPEDIFSPGRYEVDILKGNPG